ncbi:MAG: arginase family protein [Enhygromyxa sp.]
MPTRRQTGRLPVAPAGLFQVGLRGDWKDGAEAEFRLAQDARLLPVALFEQRSAASVADEIKTAVGDRPLCLGVDIDGVDDPAFCPGTDTPVPGGLSSRKLLCLLDNLAGAKIIEMDLVEVSPPHDHAHLTSTFAAYCLFSRLDLLAIGQAARRTGSDDFRGGALKPGDAA